MEKLSRSNNSGQVLLVILLMMAVILTIGLSTISRSITDIKISEQTEDSARAFSAAEAGVEAILSGLGTGGLSGINVQTTTGSLLSGDNKTFMYPQQISQNEIATIWLSTYTAGSGYSGNMGTQDFSVGWGNPNTPASDNVLTPALEVSYYYNNSGIKVAKLMLDPNISRQNGFCHPGVSCEGGLVTISTSGCSYANRQVQFCANISRDLVTNWLGATGTFYFARLRLLYGSGAHYVGFGTPNGTLPTQGDLIAATGTSNQAVRKVQVYRLKPAPPDVFDFALYSGGSLVK